MRYTFQQFLELQNDLNKRKDKKLIEEIIDTILSELEQEVKYYPTIHHYTFGSINFTGKRKIKLENLTSTEQKAISDYLTDMGFRVEWKTRFYASDTLDISW